MRKTILLRTADGLIAQELRVDKSTFVIERLIVQKAVFDPNKKIEAFQPSRIRRYRFEGNYFQKEDYSKPIEIFDEVL